MYPTKSTCQYKSEKIFQCLCSGQVNQRSYNASRGPNHMGYRFATNPSHANTLPAILSYKHSGRRLTVILHDSVSHKLAWCLYPDDATGVAPFTDFCPQVGRLLTVIAGSTPVVRTAGRSVTVAQ